TAVPGVVAGSLLYVNISTKAVSMVLGCVLVLSVPLRRWLNHRKIYASTGTLIAFGFPYGLVSGMAVGAGMLLVPILLGTGIAGPALLATDALVAVAMNIAKI